MHSPWGPRPERRWPGRSEPLRMEHQDLGRLSNVGEDPIARIVVHGPPGPAGERDGSGDPESVEVHHRNGALLPHRLAEVEDEQPLPGGIVGQPVGVLAHAHPGQECLVRALVHADLGGLPIRGEQQVPGGIDQDAGDARVIRQRAEEGVSGAIDHVHAVRPGVGDVEATSAQSIPIHVGVVEPGLGPGWERDEAPSNQPHARGPLGASRRPRPGAPGRVPCS